MVCIEIFFSQAHSLKDVGSRYKALYTIYMGSPSSPIIFKYIYVFKNLITYIVLRIVENKTMPILDINNHNTMYIFATKDTHATFRKKLKSSVTSTCLTYSNNELEE